MDWQESCLPFLLWFFNTFLFGWWVFFCLFLLLIPFFHSNCLPSLSFFFFSFKRMEETHSSPDFMFKRQEDPVSWKYSSEICFFPCLFAIGILDRSRMSAVECQNTTDERTGAEVHKHTLFIDCVARKHIHNLKVLRILHSTKIIWLKSQIEWKTCAMRFKTHFVWNLNNSNKWKKHLNVWCFCRNVTWYSN